jgi:glycosyltransferase involved in cell wall biosynthesis
MRIALFHNLPSGGAKRAVYEWVRRMAGSHTFDVYTLSTADHEFCDFRPFVSSYTIHEFHTHKLFHSPFGRLNQVQRIRDLADPDRLHEKIAGLINAGGYDVLFAQTSQFTFIPPLLQYVKIPSVYYLHEPIGTGFFRRYSRPYLAEGSRQAVLDRFDPLVRSYRDHLLHMQKCSISNTNKLLANSRYTNLANEAIFDRSAQVCPLGVDLDEFHPLPNVARENFVISVGEMSARKGFDFIVESLSRIQSSDRPLLKLACNRINVDELKYVEGLAARHRVDIEVLSHLGVDELTRLYNRARFCVYAPVMEPFGLITLESLACGTPVVGIREGGLPESIQHEINGLLVDRDLDLFAQAILQLIKNPDLIETYGRNGREIVAKQWTWDRSVSLLESHLMECAYHRVTN